MVVYEKKILSSLGHNILTELNKNVLIENYYKTIYESVRIDRSSYRVIQHSNPVEGKSVKLVRLTDPCQSFISFSSWASYFFILNLLKQQLK